MTEHCRGNNYVHPFFAENTFETELILAGNKNLFINVLPKIYAQQARINEWKKIINDANKSRLCHSALYLANKVGKGWFAIELAEQVTPHAFIPEYILAAISHALKGHQKDFIHQKMMAYRLKFFGQDFDGIMLDVNGGWSDCIDVCRDIIPDDPLFKLMDME